MEKILVLGFASGTGDGSKALREAVAAGRDLAALLSAELHVGVVGDDVAGAVAELGGAVGTPVIAVEGEPFGSSRYATDAAALEAIASQVGPTWIVGVGSARMSRVFAGLAARLGGRADTHACGWAVDGGILTITRWFYRQRMKGVLTRTQRPWAILLDPGVVSPWVGSGASPTVEKIALEVSEDRLRTRVVEVLEPPASERTIIPDAELLFVAGAGWTKKQADGNVHLEEAEKSILGFLRLSHASLGGSKSMVDLSSEGHKVLSFMTHLNQIGQTGATPRHAKGLSTCCHGEEPHVVGWRFINERRAINTDPNCGWAQGKADVLYVADAFAVMAKVNEILSRG